MNKGLNPYGDGPKSPKPAKCEPAMWTKVDDLTDQINKVQAELTKLRRMIETQNAQIESINTRMKPVGGFLDD